MAKSPVGFMDLATEPRLEIYGLVFSTFNKDHSMPCMASIPCCPNGFPAKRSQRYVPPTVCKRVPVDILRVNKTIYNEALAVMLVSVDYVASYEPPRCFIDSRDKDHTTLDHLLATNAIAPHVRSLTIATDMPDLTVRRLDGVTGMLELCETLRDNLPKLGELRLHIDVPRWSQINFILFTDRHALLFAELIRFAPARTTFVGVHMPFRGRRYAGAVDTERISAWTEEVVKHMNKEAEKLGGR